MALPPEDVVKPSGEWIPLSLAHPPEVSPPLATPGTPRLSVEGALRGLITLATTAGKLRGGLPLLGDGSCWDMWHTTQGTPPGALSSARHPGLVPSHQSLHFWE